jgi:hypothetical protein
VIKFFVLSMIFSENLFPLFRIMLQREMLTISIAAMLTALVPAKQARGRMRDRRRRKSQYNADAA